MAERRVGEMLAEMEMRRKNPGPGRGKKVSSGSETFSLKAYSITSDQSSDWQQLAAIPPDEFSAT